MSIFRFGIFILSIAVSIQHTAFVVQNIRGKNIRNEASIAFAENSRHFLATKPIRSVMLPWSATMLPSTGSSPLRNFKNRIFARIIQLACVCPPEQKIMRHMMSSSLSLTGGSRKNSIRIRRNRHRTTLQDSRTDALAKIIKRRRKVERISSKKEMSSLLLAMNKGINITDETKSNCMNLTLGTSNIEDFESGLPMFKNLKKSARRAGRMKVRAPDKKEARRREKMRARFEQHGRSLLSAPAIPARPSYLT